VPLERRGSALGMLGAIWGLAAIVGPNLGGLLTHYFSWHWIFAANVPLGIVVIALAQRYVPTLAPQKRGPLDIAGILLLGIGLLGVMVGLTRLDARAASLEGLAADLALPVAAVAFGLLVLVERRAVAPILAPGLFATRQLILTYSLEILIGLLEGALFFIPAALTAADHLNPAQSGAVAAVGALVFVAVIPLAGRALDAVGSRTVLLVGASLTGAGLVLFALALTSLPLSIVGLIVASVGFGALLGAPTRYIITNEAPPSLRATAVGILSVFLIMGQIVGGSLAGGIIGNDIGSVAGYRQAYEAFAAIAVLAVLGTLLLASRAQERHAPVPEP
jgi:MFS family permease